ncbi:YjbF family lipoprotein [Stenotrophomonas sp. GD03958]|uniref:YjbF family lipoprotein n=1 Tax=Stenotrophomonas sp. GD03958 TaxID=2975411 RepID=UPI000739766A|nr:YjbF family lipoprotein [Stenotrophomonas sp. GD03958]MDH1192793.1 YjbF family lipoprotein [Stenotrophomonas sp. GD03958]CRD63776.1 putative lipoprotein [Stenotrophomonas maltophilia]
MARMDAACHRPAHRAHGALLLVAVAALLFTGCTTGSRSTLDTFRLITHRPAQATAEGVASNRFPQMQVETPDLTAVAVLGYVDGGRQQWFAGSHAVFEMDAHGLLLGGSGLGQQWHARIDGPSPFDDLRTVTTPVAVQRRYDWIPAYQVDVAVTGILSRGELEQVEILGSRRTLQRFDEQLQGGGMSGRNVYWADPATGFIWKSRQHLAPGRVAELTQLKPYRPAKD